MTNLSPEQQKYFAWLLTCKKSGDDDMRLAGVLSEAKVDLNPHQVEAVLFALRSPFSKGVILADEVGLGKTIEAGIVISQTWAEMKRHILIIVPATLRRQWMMEMEDKFYLQSEILERRSTLAPDILMRKHCLFICSFQYAARHAEELKAINWNLVVIDEAHKLRNVYRNTNSQARRIADAFREFKKLLLTATPLQNNIQELYGLVSVIDDKYFGDLRSFNAQYGYSSLADKHSFSDLKGRIHNLIHRTLRKQVTEYVKYTSRIPMSQEYSPSDKEIELYNRLSVYLMREDTYGLPSSQRTLLLLLIRKLMASSSFAVAGSVKAIISRLQKMIENQATSGRLELDEDESMAADFSDIIGDDEDEWEEDDDENNGEEQATLLTPEQVDSIKKEIEELQSIYDLAVSIKQNNKGECLLQALQIGFDKMKVLGANRKALIFTESRRTQEYLFQLLEDNGYKGKIVLFNGSNNDAKSKQIYADWLKANEGKDVITASKSANKRQALVDYFRNTADIMIATEAASEGINLQFCSLVINFDLPWNPQRVEQRIGRCHRYGQKNDVVVCNFINVKNEADVRVYQLLYEKFHLFDGIFGSSDEVLGSVESGVDFEKRMLDIYQHCRTPDEINAAFDHVQQEMDEQIRSTMKTTREQLLENFDEDVISKLNVRKDKDQGNITKVHQWLYDLAINYDKSVIQPIDNDKLIFRLLNNPFKDTDATTGIYQVTNGDTEHMRFRIGSSLAQSIITEDKQRQIPAHELVFDYEHHPYKISQIEQTPCTSGWIYCQAVTYSNEGQSEDNILLTATDDEGNELSHELAEKLMGVSANVAKDITVPVKVKEDEQSLMKIRQDALSQYIGERNEKMMQEEIQHIEAWADDKEVAIEKEIKLLKQRKRETQRLLAKADSMQEKLQLEENLKKVSKDLRRKRADQDDMEEEIDKQRSEMIDKLKTFMAQKITTEDLFLIHFTIKR